MSIYRVVGEEILSAAEYRATSRRTAGARTRGGQSAAAQKQDAAGAALLKHQQELIAEIVGQKPGQKRASATRAAPGATSSPFKEVGLGKPLTVLIAHVYTGKYPKLGLFESSEDMLLTTACKDDSVFNAMPRAVNYLVPDIKPRTSMKAPPATTEGTRVVYYSPALTLDSLIITFEIKFHDYGPDLMRKIGAAANTAGGLPVFAPASPYLLAAGMLINIGAKIGESLFDADAVLSVTDTLEFATAGEDIVQADFRIVARPGFDHSDLKYQPGSGIVSKATGKAYDGDEPCIVVSIDGTEKPKLAGFTPTHASAAVLQKFYEVSDGASSVIDSFVDAMKVVNDLKFREDADQIMAKLAKTSDPAQKATLQAQLDADLKNISDDRLKPPAGS